MPDDYAETIEQIAAGLAHEVKNPISLVRANLDFLELFDTQHKHSVNYAMMRRELDKVNGLLVEFITLLKPVKKDARPLDIKKIVTDITSNISAAMSEIEISTEITGEDFTIFGDETKITGVFDNIFKNAAEAMDYNGAIEIKIYKENGYVTVAVKDNGCGMEDAEKAAEAFFTTKKGGSGIGLFMTKNTILQHKGEFLIDSEQGKGCKVTVKLPEYKPM